MALGLASWVLGWMGLRWDCDLSECSFCYPGIEDSCTVDTWLPVLKILVLLNVIMELKILVLLN